MSAVELKGVIFDLDGVITDTARVHALAWERMFNNFLAKRAAEADATPVPFDPDQDYLRYVDGKPRPQGVQSFLESRNITLPFGDLNDPPDAETICGLGNTKNADFQQILRKEGPDVFESSVALVRALRKKGIRVAVASSSRNCRLILKLARLSNLFEARVDGEVSQELGLKGKPNPDIFVVAAQQMGLQPGECVVVEDAISGVQAGRNGNFGLVLGIARSQPGAVLQQHGADLVVSDLGELDVPALMETFAQVTAHDGWHLTYHGFDPAEEKLREALCTVGNGYLGTRGCLESARAGAHHYPGTYLAGIYDRQTSAVHGRNIVNNDLVNCPNWLPIRFRINGEDWIDPVALELLSYTQQLSLRDGLLTRTLVTRDRLGRMTRVQTERLASMADPHCCALRYQLTPLNYSAPITISSSLDGAIENQGVDRYRNLASRHFQTVARGKAADGIVLVSRTRTSGYQMALAAGTRVREGAQQLRVSRRVCPDDDRVSETLSFVAKENTTYTVDKVVAVFTSRDPRIKNPKRAAQQALQRYPSFDLIRRRHARAWDKLWQKADVQITGDRLAQKAIRLHIYHLLSTTSPHTQALDVGLPARGLHGEAYRGHIFWDELFILPFFDLHFPEISRAQLLFRYCRLDAARHYARENGYQGAMYPWQTADDGAEETQEVHFNPADQSWGPDLSRRQRHVSIAVFFNVWRYVSLTGDHRFLRDHGAEMMLEIARFWASLAQPNPADPKHHIPGVMGPDEFHEQLPGAPEPGLEDNAYTNVMVVWLLEQTLAMLDTLPPAVLARLRQKTGFDPVETKKWRQLITTLAVSVAPDGTIEQFAGYFDLAELDWDQYRAKYGNIHRMDRILKAEGSSPDNFKVAKQADVLMLYYLLPAQEVARILRQVDIPVDDSQTLLEQNYQYYAARTSHGSTLSKVVHGMVASFVSRAADPWPWFVEAIRSDLFDTQGGTTPEGIHCGVMAGTLEMVRRYFAGVDINERGITITPCLPDHWQAVAFRFCHQRRWYEVKINHRTISVSVDPKGKKPVELCVLGRTSTLAPGARRTFRYVSSSTK